MQRQATESKSFEGYTDRISLVIDGLLPYFGRAIGKTGMTNANAIVDFLSIESGN